LTTVKNLRVKVDIGSVRVEGGSQSSINYVIRNHSYSGSEDKARREFDSYKISAYVRGDTAWIVGDWEGGRPRKFSGAFRQQGFVERNDLRHIGDRIFWQSGNPRG